MKKASIYFTLLLTLSLGLMSCGDDDDQQVDLPQVINDYLAANYPNYEVDESEEEILCDGTAVYEVELEDSNDNEVELTFNTEGALLFTETEINNNQLPTAVTNSISSNYPDYEMDEADQLDMADGSIQYQVEIENGNSELEVTLAADGTVLCEEEDDDD